MVMLRPPGKPQKVAKEVLKNKGITVPKDKGIEKVKNPPNYPTR